MSGVSRSALVRDGAREAGNAAGHGMIEAAGRRAAETAGGAPARHPHRGGRAGESPPRTARRRPYDVIQQE